MDITLTHKQITEALDDYSGDVDFMVEMVDNLTRSYTQTREVIMKLYENLPDSDRIQLKEDLQEKD